MSPVSIPEEYKLMSLVMSSTAFSFFYRILRVNLIPLLNQFIPILFDYSPHTSINLAPLVILVQKRPISE